MAKRASNTRPPVGLVARKGPLAARIGKIVDGGGFRLAFQVAPEEVESSSGIRDAEVVVVVTGLDSRDGSLLRSVRARCPEARIVACSEPVESPTIRWALELGVEGLIWDDRVETGLDPTMRAVRAGQVVVPQEVLRKQSVSELTNREKQTLSMVIMGLTNLEIAQKLFVSENTVKSHLNTAYKKLGVHSRTEAQRLITDPDRGLGTGILAITASGLTRGRPPRKERG
jgi:DNA-binding NarL/FixJ family response regulator